MRFGYTRTGLTADEDWRLRAPLIEAGIDERRIYSDEKSVLPLWERAGFSSMMSQIRAGDVVVFAWTDRVFRSAENFFGTWERLRDSDVRMMTTDTGRTLKEVDAEHMRAIQTVLGIERNNVRPQR